MKALLILVLLASNSLALDYSGGGGSTDCTTDCTFTSITTNGTAPSAVLNGIHSASSVTLPIIAQLGTGGIGIIGPTTFSASSLTVRNAPVVLIGHAVPFLVGTSTMAIEGDTGDVGIGIANPTQRLHVYENAANTETFLKVEGAASGANEAAGALHTSGANTTLMAQFSTAHGSRPGQSWIATLEANPLVFGTSDAEKVRIAAAGGLRPYSRTIAQLMAIAPAQTGEMYFCNDCSPVKMAVSTGTSAGNFASIDGGAFQ